MHPFNKKSPPPKKKGAHVHLLETPYVLQNLRVPQLYHGYLDDDTHINGQSFLMPSKRSLSSSKLNLVVPVSPFPLIPMLWPPCNFTQNLRHKSRKSFRRKQLPPDRYLCPNNRGRTVRCARAVRKVGHYPPPVGSFLGVGLPQGTIAIVYLCSINPPPSCVYVPLQTGTLRPVYGHTFSGCLPRGTIFCSHFSDPLLHSPWTLMLEIGCSTLAPMGCEFVP